MNADESAGGYEKKQLLSSSTIVNFSHRSRFKLARELVSGHAGRRLLDYGCGDGTFLKFVVDAFPGAVGADANRGQLEDCRRRLGRLGLSFHHVDEIEADAGSFDVVVCMETLEHCLPDAVERVLSDLSRLVARDGLVLISVPIEVGPTLLGKQAVRRILGWRKVGDYAFGEHYSLRELATMLFADDGTSIVRPSYAAQGPDAMRYHGHKGFNWKALRRTLERRFRVEEVRFSPFGWSKGLVSSQAWFLCRP